MQNRQPLSRGFTLVEVLIVIAVIVIITAILFPVFVRIRENGRRATCVSHLKQLGLAWQMYADDSDGRQCRILTRWVALLSFGLVL
jgi:prepilin-type N-terminal cleavage/methylation domain-containing protein